MCFQNAGNVISEPLFLKGGMPPDSLGVIKYEPPPTPPTKSKLCIYLVDV